MSSSFESTHSHPTSENDDSCSVPRSSDHHVSCEDLLDFAVDKPSPKPSLEHLKEHGSDAVRVMQKVLANEVNCKLVNSVTATSYLFAFF
jgi:hypothetical protein